MMVHRFRECPCGYALEQQNNNAQLDSVPLTEESAEKKRNYGTDTSDGVERFQLHVSKTATTVAVAVGTTVTNGSDLLKNFNSIIRFAVR